MTPEKCPNCGTKLRKDMLSCPNCPMSFPEDDPASRVHPLKQSKYYQFLLPSLFFLALGYLVWSLGMGLFHLGEQSADGNDVSGMMHGAVPTVENPTQTQRNVAMGVSEAPKTPAPAPEPPAEEVVIVAHDSEPTSISNSVSEPPAPPRKAVREWRLRGSVIDLVSLKPLSSVAVVFVDQQQNRRIETRTDSSGMYRTVVPSLPDRGYTVQIAKDGYSPTYLDPSTDGVKRMTVDKRRALARDLGATFTSEPATVQAPDGKPLVTDFYLAPRQ